MNPLCLELSRALVGARCSPWEAEQWCVPWCRQARCWPSRAFPSRDEGDIESLPPQTRQKEEGLGPSSLVRGRRPVSWEPPGGGAWQVAAGGTGGPAWRPQSATESPHCPGTLGLGSCCRNHRDQRDQGTKSFRARAEPCAFQPHHMGWSFCPFP